MSLATPSSCSRTRQGLLLPSLPSERPPEPNQTASRSDRQHSRRQRPGGVRKRRGGRELRDGSPAGAIEPQPKAQDLQVRIGIHLGDVVDKGGDLFGTAVNVAARLEGIAQPGGIVVSAAVRDAIAGKLPASFTDLGLKTLKNIEEPLRAYALSPRAGSHLARRIPCRRSPPITQQAVHRRPAIREPERRPRARVFC